jgi:Protein of unknown function (DUF1761)
MRYQGHNVLAIAAAAVVIYLLEFLLYGVAIQPEQFRAMSGMSEAQGNAIGMARMPFGAIMPILAAIGLSLAVKWRGAMGPAAGAMTGVLMGVCFAFAGRMYAYVYGADTETYLLIDLARFVVTYAIGGAIIAAWK